MVKRHQHSLTCGHWARLLHSCAHQALGQMSLFTGGLTSQILRKREESNAGENHQCLLMWDSSLHAVNMLYGHWLIKSCFWLMT